MQAFAVDQKEKERLTLPALWGPCVPASILLSGPFSRRNEYALPTLVAGGNSHISPLVGAPKAWYGNSRCSEKRMMINLMDMEQVCDRIADKLRDDRIDWDQIGDVATVLMLLTGRLERAALEHRSTYGATPEMTMATLSLQLMAGRLRSLRDCDTSGPTLEVRGMLNRVRRSVRHAMSMMERAQSVAYEVA